MAQIAGIQDFRKQGTPADIGIFQMATGAMVFQFIFSGTTYICAIRAGLRGWDLISYGADAVTVINAAINAESDVYVDEGTYTIVTTPIMPIADTKLRGAGNSTIFYQGDDENLTAVVFVDGETTSAPDVFLSSFQVDGNDGAQTSVLLTDNHGVQVAFDCDYIRIENLNVHDCKNLGICFFTGTDPSHSVDSIISNCICWNNRDGIAVDHYHRRILITDNICHDNDDYGIGTAVNAQRVKVIGNIVHTNGSYGVFMNITYAQIEDNFFYNNARGLHVVGVYAYVESNYMDMEVTDNLEYAMSFTNCLILTIKNNYIRSLEGGIYISGTSHDIKLSDNFIFGGWIHDNARDAIRLGDGADAVTFAMVRDNYICGQAGDYRWANGIIEVAPSDSNRFFGNDFRFTVNMVTVVGASTRVPSRWFPIWDDTHAQVSIGNIGNYVSLLMAADQDITIRFNIGIPDSFQELISAVIEVVPTTATPTLRWGIDTDWSECGEAYDANSDSIALANEDLTQNDKECLDISAGLTGIAAEETVGVEFTREGSNVGDDAGDTHVLGCRIRYV